MRSPYAPLDPRAVTPVTGAARSPAREGTGGERTFAELLAQAEAVQDHIEIRRGAAPGWGRGIRHAVQDAVQGAAGLFGRQTPWLGLPLLMRRQGSPRRG